MEKHHKFSIGYTILGICFTFWLQHLIFTNLAIKTIPYSQFLHLLKEGKIISVAITQSEIQGSYKESKETSGKATSFKTVRVDPQTSALFEQHQVTYSGRIESNFIPTLLSWTLPTLFFLGIWIFLMKRMMKQRIGFMTLGKQKAKIYVEEDLNISFDDVAGIDEAKDELLEIVQFLEEPDRYTQIGGKMPKGILLVGPPGTGKTLLAKAVAGESGVPFFSLSGSEFVEMFAGLGASRVRDLFEQAKALAPCIIFIDELDALGKARNSFAAGGHDEREQTLNQLLVEMDGFDSANGVVLIAATNRPEILDPALLRAGRFDRQVLVDRPDKKGRETILRIHLKDIPVESDVDIDTIAGMTSGMVGADLANLVNEAALLTVRNKRTTVCLKAFEEAIERLMAGLQRKNRLINPKERAVIACHEMGHAIVACSLPGTDPVQKISIIPRGIAALGYTLQRPTEDRFLMSKNELLNRIATLLGGRAAEEVNFGEISTGAANDLSRATDIAQSMVKEYGMSHALGQVYFARKRNSAFLSTPPEGVMTYSDDTALLIDQEMKRILDEQYEKATMVLKQKRHILEKGTRLLLEKEIIESKAIESLMEEKSGSEPLR